MSVTSCIVIGDAAATLRCAQIAQERGIAVLGVVTGDARIGAWAAQSGLPCCFAPAGQRLAAEDILGLTESQPIDFLFSIHNLRRLDPQVLALPRRLAVNYHDAPLPRYAGLHATTWAIARGEREHGITWHRMVERIDAGAILLQHRFALAPSETAWTLNARCTEAAIRSFPELLELLMDSKSDGTGGIDQDLSRRTVFPGWRRPVPGGVLPWSRSAVELEALVRALDFGPADQPLGMAKLLGPSGTFLVTEIETLAHASGAPPGTVVADGPRGCEVATGGTDVRLRAVTDLDGCPIAPAEQSRRFGMTRGEWLPVEAPNASALAARERDWLRHENAWLAALEDLAALVPPVTSNDAGTRTAATVPLPDSLLGDGAEALAVAAVFAWLVHDTGEPLDIAFGEPDLVNEIVSQGWSGLLAARPPLRLELRSGATLRSFAETVAAERRRRRALGTYALDLGARNRKLRGRVEPRRPAVAVHLRGRADGVLDDLAGYELVVVIDLEAKCCEVFAAGAESRAARCAAFLERCAADPGALLPRRPGRTSRHHGDARVLGLVERVRASADAAPDSVAVEGPGFRLTYRELVERSTRLARALRRRGVRREHRVALRFADSKAGTNALADLVTALLGVLEAGGAFLVLEPQDPPARQERILATAQPSLLIGDGAFDWLAPRWGVRLTPQTIALADAPEQSPRAARDGQPESWAEPWAEPSMPSDLVYLAFTSGSTGEPKGVAVEHGSIAGYLDAACRAFGLGPGDRLLQTGSPAFDLAYEQIFVALGSGAALIALPTRELPSTRDLVEQCDHLGITALDVPTALFERMARDLALLEQRLPPALRLVVIGGENASVKSAQAWFAAARGPLRLLNTYGPTEATIVATWREFTHAEELAGCGPSLPIGRAVAGAETLLLDDERRPVGAGRAGELWLGGPGLARGYHRRPGLTAERFLALDTAGERRFYRTGDRARQLPSGDLEFLGRVDRQVKIRGRRVEPGEVEAVLRGIAGVRDVAMTVDLRDGLAHLRAWVVLDGGAPGLETIRAEAARQLPSYMLPVFEAVAALPRSGAGKVDLSALTDSQPAPPSDPPREGVETRLAALWRALLGGPVPSRHDDFFALGADSLAAVGLLAAIEHEFGQRLEISALLEVSSLAGIAARLARPRRVARPGEAPTCLVPLQARGGRPPLYCAHGLGGHLLRLLPLAAALAPDQPLVGLQSPGLDDAEQVPSTIEALAARFLAEIRAVDAGTPLHLAGMSYGGIVAFEMARQASEAGIEVALLAMLDTDLGEVLPGFRPSAPGWRARLAGWLRRLGGDAIGHARRRLRRLRNAGDRIHKANEYRHFTRVLRRNERSLRRYVPGTYRGPVTFLAATDRAPALYLAFEELTGCALEHVPVAGGHLGMLEPPHVAGLARELKRRVGDGERRAALATAPPLRGA